MPPKCIFACLDGRDAVADTVVESSPGAASASEKTVRAPADGVSARALIVGGASIVILAIVNPYLQFLLQSWWIVGVGALLTGPVLTLFALVALNGLLVRLWPGRAFTRRELLVVYGMGMVSLGFLGHGGLPYLVSLVTYPFYMATPENGWEHLVWPYIPLWLRPGSVQAIDWFWEGLPRGQAFPWGAWVSPALYWSLFTAALLAAMYCLGALLSKDWIERQRLTYPLVEVPLSMTGEAERPTIGASLFRNRIFWIGFAIPAFVGLIQWLNRFFPNVPAMETYRIHIGKAFVGMGLPWSVLGETHFSILWDVLGVMCLIPSEVSLSLWLFYVLYKVQLVVWASFGVAEGGTNAFINPPTFIGFEEAGGFLALAGVLLWESRHALKKAFLSIAGRADESDALDPLPGRAAAVGFVLANAGMLWFAVRAGMSWWTFALLMGAFYALLIGASRLVAAGGVMYIGQGAPPRGVIVRTLGARPLGPGPLVMYAYLTGIYMNDPYNLAMPQMMNSFKLIRTAGIRGKRFTYAAALAVALMLAAGVPAMLKMMYTHGAAKLGDWPFSSWGRWVFGEVDTSLKFPEPPDNWLRLALALGAGLMLGLSWLHMNMVWWPVSPVGFIIASSWCMDSNLWSCALIGWLVVTLIKRHGGLRLYRTLRPAFLGLIIGAYLSSALFGFANTIIDYRRIMG